MHGAVDDRGKFDELVVPAGARFTFELMVSHNSPKKLADLVALLASGDLRIGKGTRRGLGTFKVVRVRGRKFNLANKDDLKALRKVPVAIEEAALSKELQDIKFATGKKTEGWLHGRLTLRPIGTWMIGGGIPTEREPRRQGKDRPWDRVPLTEKRITWKSNGTRDHGAVEEVAPFVVPGSSVKGAIRHRTAFHARRLEHAWFNLESLATPDATDAETALFGEVRGKDDSSSRDGHGSTIKGHPGRVHISDVYVTTAPYVPIQHVSLDRFTQGPMDHLLYDEVALGSCTLNLEVSIRMDADLPNFALPAIKAAFEDLRLGRLSIGASRGHGRFLGEIQWSDAPPATKEKK